MSDAELKNLMVSVITAQKENEKRQQETDRQLKELGKQIGGLGNKFGSFTEGLAFPALEKILTKDFKLTNIHFRNRSIKKDKIMEIDALAYSNTDQNIVIVAEVKSYLDERGIKQTLQILKDFDKFYPQLADKKLYGMIATVDISNEMKNRVLEEGLYLLIVNEESFKLLKPKNFTPKCFSKN
jgi:hypothetical protein